MNYSLSLRYVLLIERFVHPAENISGVLLILNTGTTATTQMVQSNTSLGLSGNFSASISNISRHLAGHLGAGGGGFPPQSLCLHRITKKNEDTYMRRMGFVPTTPTFERSRLAFFYFKKQYFFPSTFHNFRNLHVYKFVYL
jgi:hypothetical protein